MEKEKYENLSAAIDRINKAAEHASESCQSLAEGGLNFEAYKALLPKTAIEAGAGYEHAKVKLELLNAIVGMLYFIESLGMSCTLNNYRISKEIADRDNLIADLNATVSDLSNRLAKLESQNPGMFGEYV